MRFLLVLSRQDRDDGDVTIGGGKLVVIHIGKRERIDISRTQLIRPRRRASQNCREEKILQQADERA